MGKAKPFLFGSLLGASVMFVAMQYHAVRSHDGFQLVPRTPQASLGLAFADIREWDATRWTDRAELARALMAHGSGDLISESVAANLADTVSTESATLDQLRSFLNRSPASDATGDQDLFKLPALNPLKNDGAGTPASDQDLFTIPLPREAAKSSVADPFRVARTGESSNSNANPNSNAITNGGTAASGFGSTTPQPGTAAAGSGFGSPAATNSATRSLGSSGSGERRFSVDDILDSGAGFFQEDQSRATSGNTGGSGPAARSTTAAPVPGTLTSKPAATSTRQLADQFEQSIFGSATGTDGPINRPAATGSAAGGTAPGSPFEDISNELESRARAALNRAESSLADQAQQSLNNATSSGGTFVRDRMGLSSGSPLPPSNSSFAQPSSGLSEETLRALREKFDPFVD